MNVLILYYSLTGQASVVAQIADKTLCEAGATVTRCRVDFADPAIRPQRPFKLADVKRWSAIAAAGQQFDITIDPLNALNRRYDLILLLSNTWQKHPAPPIRSLLSHPDMKRILYGTPIATYVISRRLWRRNAEVVEQETTAAGASTLGCWHFGHCGGAITSLFTTIAYMLSKADGVMWPLPQYGLSDEAIARVAPTTHEVLSKAQAWRSRQAAEA